MIQNPVVFSASDLSLISQKLASPSFSKDTWSDEDLISLKEKIKNHYVAEQNNTCPYCQQILRSSHGRVWDTEHIIPRSYAEKFMFEAKNLCACCIDCNSAKSHKRVTNSKAKVRLPLRPQDYFIIHPHLDNYHQYILVIKAGFYYVALEEKGKNTIEVCELNRFYEFANYDSSLSGDDRILMLAEALGREADVMQKQQIRNEITFLSIQGNRS